MPEPEAPEFLVPSFDPEDPVGEFFNGVVETFYGANGDPEVIRQGMAALLSRRSPPPRMMGTTSDAQAEAMVDAAWQDPEGGASLAVDALRLWPDCAAAYSYLGVVAAEQPTLSLPLHSIAVLAGYAALGQGVFDEYAGQFWQIPQTRPFMDALGYLATAHLDAGSDEAAASHFAEMLNLNPHDDQGARYPLLAIALRLGDNETVERLFAAFPEEAGATFAYARALSLLQRRGDTDEARLALRAARELNPLVPEFLTGVRPIPAEFPEVNEPGGEAEALLYCDLMGAAWEATEGAVAWLRSQTVVSAAAAPPAKEKRSGPREV